MTETTYTYEQFMALSKQKAENDLFYSLTNGRKLRDNINSKDYQEKVLRGYNKIMNLLHRGIMVQTKLIQK